jgi:polar amino acid transport system substrate-binding protein
MRKSTLAIVAVLALGLALLAGCGGKKGSSSTGGTEAAGQSGEAGETANAADCTPQNMETTKSGELTIATDKPAYPPYFEDNEPENGEGFESAVGFAIGEQLGYPKAKIRWTVEPFDSSYAPGPKDFDFDVNEVSITPTREKAVDFSAPYYSANQAVVALEDSDAA